MTDRPLADRNVIQVGIIVRDIEQAVTAYAEMFGLPRPESVLTEPRETACTEYRGKPTDARAKLAFFELDNLYIELIEPLGGPSTWQEFLDTHGPGMHHIAFVVKDMDTQIARFEEMGATLVQQGRWTNNGGGRYAYIDTPQMNLILELLEFF